jgi:hypothetical protein
MQQRLYLGFLFVTVQFGGIALILFTGPVFPSGTVLLAIEIAGIILACLIHKLYIFQSLWVKQVNPDIENVGFHFS